MQIKERLCFLDTHLTLWLSCAQFYISHNFTIENWLEVLFFFSFPTFSQHPNKWVSVFLEILNWVFVGGGNSVLKMGIVCMFRLGSSRSYSTAISNGNWFSLTHLLSSFLTYVLHLVGFQSKCLYFNKFMQSSMWSVPELNQRSVSSCLYKAHNAFPLTRGSTMPLRSTMVTF